MNVVVPASSLPSFQTTITIKEQLKVNREFSMVTPSENHEISSLVDNLAFIYGPASATYIPNRTQNYGETISCHGLTDESSNFQSAPLLKKRNRERLSTMLQPKGSSVVHSGEKQFICDICWRGFTQNGSLKRHKLIHTRNDYPANFSAVAGHSSSVNDEHTCPECGKVFRTKANLKQHSVVHSEERQFICDVCHRGFSRNSSLKKHRLIHTRNTGVVDVLAFTGASSSSTQDDRTCFECGKQYSTKANLKRHAVGHSKVNPIAGAIS